MLRYTVRRPANDRHYSIWDNLKDRVAFEGSEECAQLEFEEALRRTDHLNANERVFPGEQ